MQRSETNQTCVMDEDEIERTLVRMAHQILEQNKGCENSRSWESLPVAISSPAN